MDKYMLAEMRRDIQVATGAITDMILLLDVAVYEADTPPKPSLSAKSKKKYIAKMKAKRDLYADFAMRLSMFRRDFSRNSGAIIGDLLANEINNTKG